MAFALYQLPINHDFMPQNSKKPLQLPNYYDQYYIQVKAANSSTKIVRQSKEAAIAAYHYYLQLGREVVWLGKWNGQSFEEAIIELEETEVIN